MTRGLEKVAALKQQPGVLAASLNAAFLQGRHSRGRADGGDRRRRPAIRASRPWPMSLAAYIWETRASARSASRPSPRPSPAPRPRASTGAPVVIADYADNPGGGGYSDSIGFLRAMIEAGLRTPPSPPSSIPRARRPGHAAGVGATLTLDIGGKIDPKSRRRTGPRDGRRHGSSRMAASPSPAR